MKMWMPGRFAFSTALQRAVDVLLAGPRERLSTIGFVTASATRCTDSKSPSRRGGEAGLDDVDAELLELARDHQLLLDVHGRARRLLAVAQRGVEDLYAVHRGSPFPPRSATRSRFVGPQKHESHERLSPARGPASGACRVPLRPARRAAGGLRKQEAAASASTQS